MFDRLKKAFSQADAPSSGPVVVDVVSEWAGTQGFSYSGQGDGGGFALTGIVAGKPWKLERGKSSRDYIRGEELRARAELKLNDNVSVLIMTRCDHFTKYVNRICNRSTVNSTV